jgi:hypothetical protein
LTREVDAQQPTGLARRPFQAKALPHELLERDGLADLDEHIPAMNQKREKAPGSPGQIPALGSHQLQPGPGP